MHRLTLYLLVQVILFAQQGVPRPQVRSRSGQSQQTQPAPTKPEDLCTVEGQVLSTTTGEPLGKAALILRRVETQPGPAAFAGSARSYTTTSSASGKFSITNIEPGRYRLSATRTGYVNAEYGARDYMQSGTTLSLAPRQNMSDLQLNMTPNGVITGHIVDEDREPMSYVQVQAMRYRYSQGRKQLVPYGSATTNDIGEFRLFGLPPGKYYLSASPRRGPAPDRRAATPQSEEEYVTTYFPGTTDLAAAAPLDIRAGAEFRGADVGLSKRHTVRVRGQVTDASGAPSDRRRPPSVFLVPRAGSSSMNRPSAIEPNGSFDIRGVTPGSYTLVATIQDRGKSLTSRMPVEVGNSNIENLNITINPSLSVSGQVRLEGQTAASVSTVQVNLRPRDLAAPMFGWPNLNVRVKEDGTFGFVNVNPDHYNVTLSGLPDGFYVKTIRAGGQDALAPGLDVSRGDAGPIDVVLAPNAGQATGMVQNDQQQPATGATVVLIPQERERKSQPQYYRTVTTDAAGSFTLKNIDPGQYKVYAWREVESGAYMDPEFVGPVENRGESLTIREGSQENLQLKLIS